MGWIRRHLIDHPERRRGQAMVIFALIFVVLVGFAGLSLDATHLYLVQHTAQKAVDAAALAAGKRLAGATQQSPVPNSNDLAAIAAHDFAGADGFITTRNTACDSTITSGSVTRFTTWWYDTFPGACGSASGYNTAVSIVVPPYVLTPHCQVAPYNCMQVIVRSRVQNYLMGTMGIPTTTVSASATVYAQPTGSVYDYPYPAAVYLYEPAVALAALCPVGQQCFDRTKVPARSLMSCSTVGSNCPTYWARPEASNLIVGVDGTTLNPAQDIVAMESNGDMVLQGTNGDAFCDPYGVGVTGCRQSRAIGTKGYAIAPGGLAYCSLGGAGTRLPTPCTPVGPGGASATALYGNETPFFSQTWTPRVDVSGLSTCGTLLLNGGTVASSLSSSTCAPPASEPYTVMPGKYDWIVVNHGSYSFEPGIYDITGIAPVNSNNGFGLYANGIDHSRETNTDWDLCTTAAGSPTACGGPNGLRAGVWIGRGTLNYGSFVATTYGACGGAATQSGGGGDQTIINALGVVFRFESTSKGFVSTAEVTTIGMTSPGLGQMRQVGGAPLLFDMENNSFIHIDASSARAPSSNQLNQYSGIIYQMSNATAGGVEVNPGAPTREDGEDGGTSNNLIVGQVYAYSYTSFGSPGAFDFSSGTGGAATPTVTTSGNQENSILVSSVLQAGPTPTTESLVVKYVDEWALDAYDVYVKINANSPVYFSDGIWSPRPTGGQTLPPNAAGNIPSDTNPALPTVGAAYSPRGIDSAGDPDWTMNYPVGGIYGPADGSTFRIEGDWAWGHERDLPTAVRGNDFATLTYTFPVPAGQTVTISMFMTDGDRCGDYVTSTWTFNNIGTPAPGVQVVGSVRLEQ